MKYTKEEMQKSFENGLNQGIKEALNAIGGAIAMVGIVIIVCFILL